MLADISRTDEFYDKLWGCKAPLKVKAFVWKLAKDRIPSLKNLVRRKVNLQSVLCRACEKEEETSVHLFFECEVLFLVWQHCLSWWGFKASLHRDCKLHFLQFCGLSESGLIVKNVWEVVWLSTIWVIWSTRNALIFKGKK